MAPEDTQDPPQEQDETKAGEGTQDEAKDQGDETGDEDKDE